MLSCAFIRCTNSSKTKNKYHGNTFHSPKMSVKRHQYDEVLWHMGELTSRIIAKSGIPSDRFHLGKIILQSLKDDPDMVLQIDGATGESETNASVLRRSIQCAIGFRKLGIQQGDVLILMAPNHLDIGIAFYAALYEGIVLAPIDKSLGLLELQHTFEVDQPSIVLCQSERIKDVEEALEKVKLKTKVISFDKGHSHTFAELLKMGSEEEIQNYKAADFDPIDSLAILIPTSGTTGLPKSAACTHKTLVLMEPYFWSWATEIPFIQRSLVGSPLQWLSAIINYVCSPFLKFTRVQSSLPMTQKHEHELINTYKPDFFVVSPTMLTTLLKPGDREKCDFTCFKYIYIGGSAVYADLISELKIITPNTEAVNVYGMTELTTAAFIHKHSSPPHSCGKPVTCLQHKLVDPQTGEDINEPNKNGELWLKGPGIFKGYYNNPEATKETFSEDGWFKTGDIFYRDASWNFYFVDRMKLLLKYRNHQISPVEVESVIYQHPGVLDVTVTSIPDKECGDLPVACVVRKPGHNVTAQEIKDLVKDSLADTKQLRGGVVFMNQLPTTASTKVHRRKIKEMVLNMQRE